MQQRGSSDDDRRREARRSCHLDLDHIANVPYATSKPYSAQGGRPDGAVTSTSTTSPSITSFFGVRE